METIILTFFGADQNLEKESYDTHDSAYKSVMMSCGCIAKVLSRVMKPRPQQARGSIGCCSRTCLTFERTLQAESVDDAGLERGISPRREEQTGQVKPYALAGQQDMVKALKSK